MEISPRPLVWGAHIEFDPTNLAKLPPQRYNWISACKTEQVLSPETLAHLEALKKFLRTHQQQPGTFTTILNALDAPGPRTSGKNKRPILPPENGIGGSSGPFVKRQRSSGGASSAVGFGNMGAPRHDPAPILPPLAQFASNLQVPFMQGRKPPPSVPSSDDDALLIRVQNLEKVMKKHTAMVESSHSTVSELDDCLAELIAKCTERKEQAKVVALKVERLETRLGIENTNGTPASVGLKANIAGNNDALVDEQSVRIIRLEKRLKTAEEERRAYQVMVEERFRKLEMRLKQEPLQREPNAQQKSTPLAKPVIKPSPFQNRRIAVEIGSHTPNSASKKG